MQLRKLSEMTLKRVFVVGGAGFIGSHFVDRLLGIRDTEAVMVYDNFTSGREWHFESHLKDDRFTVVRGEVADTDFLSRSMKGYDTVIHLASNPDIAAAMVNPTIDFVEGTALTNSVVEAMRISDVPLVLYASGSGVYGDIGEVEGVEDVTPMLPASTYGASKLAGEAMVCAYAQMFGLRGYAFRFGNVVGPRQTHGVGFDFVRRLLDDPTRLRILGDGTQSKSYIHVDDVVSAVLGVALNEESRYRAFNVATLDYITVTEIAEIAVEILELRLDDVEFEYTGGDRGWKGDVPVVRLNSERIRSKGWVNRRTCREAIRDSLLQLLPDARAGRL